MSRSSIREDIQVFAELEIMFAPCSMHVTVNVTRLKTLPRYSIIA